MFTVHSTDANYLSPLIGNGEVVTVLGPTGYHNGTVPERELPNRNLFWAGRRLPTPTHALIRFGQLQRILTLDGRPTQDATWTQTLDYDRATLISTLDHGAVTEQTRSLICLKANVAVFRTRLENTSSAPVRTAFTLRYTLPTVIEEALHFPYMTHFDFREGYTPPSSGDVIRQRPHIHPDDQSLSVQYHIAEELGEVRIGWYPAGRIVELDSGGEFTQEATLNPGDHAEYCFWVMLSDRRKYTHWPDYDRVRALLAEHEHAWADFWGTSRVEIDDERLQGLYQTCLYAIRSNASPWSIPPAYLATSWEGRTFHDELYPFLALLSAGHVDLAARVPHFRLRALTVALQRGGGDGARFPWESLETGEEGGPYGHWMDERFHTGQFSETAWRYFLYIRDHDELARLYPLLRECADLFIKDVIVRDANGALKTRLLTDFDEQTYPVANGLFTLCAAIRSLENAAQAAEVLGVDEARRALWRDYAHALRPALPVNASGDYYLPAANADYWHVAQVGPMFPFGIDPDSTRARDTLTRLTAALRTHINTTSGSPPGYAGTHWMWTTGMLAVAFFMQGRAEEGYELLRQAPNSAGPFLAPTEHVREGDPPAFLVPWFTTGAGAVAYAVHSLFVLVDAEGTTLLNGLALPDARFERLLAADGVRVSGEVRDGGLNALQVESARAMTWRFRLPQSLADAASFTAHVTEITPADDGRVWITCELAEGSTSLI